MRRTTAIRFPLAIDAGLGRLAVESDDATHIEQLMQQVLFTNPGERVNRPDFGCGIRRMVFAPNSELAASLAQVTIYQALEKWLGELIGVDAVEVQSREETLEVRIMYRVLTHPERRYLNVEVTI